MRVSRSFISGLAGILVSVALVAPAIAQSPTFLTTQTAQVQAYGWWWAAYWNPGAGVWEFRTDGWQYDDGSFDYLAPQGESWGIYVYSDLEGAYARGVWSTRGEIAGPGLSAEGDAVSAMEATDADDTAGCPPIRFAGCDSRPPTPDPMTWAHPPLLRTTNTIRMEATTAEDVSRVEYCFEMTQGPVGVGRSGAVSPWQDSVFYEYDTGGVDGPYGFRVKARDKSPFQNETAWSEEKVVVTDHAAPIVVDIVRTGGAAWEVRDASHVAFTVTFNMDVTGLGKEDFWLSGSYFDGATTAAMAVAISGITGPVAVGSYYEAEVTVATGYPVLIEYGVGTVELEIVDNPTIHDAATGTHQMGGPYRWGEDYYFATFPCAVSFDGYLPYDVGASEWWFAVIWGPSTPSFTFSSWMSGNDTVGMWLPEGESGVYLYSSSQGRYVEYIWRHHQQLHP